REFPPRDRELGLRGLRVAEQIVPLVGLHGLHRVQLPVGRLRSARAGREQHAAQDQGSLISDSRWNGHLRFTSSIIAETRRRLASTSARSAPRSVVAAFTLPLTAWASARSWSAFFRLSRTSPRIWLTCVTTPCSPNRRWSVLPTMASS